MDAIDYTLLSNRKLEEEMNRLTLLYTEKQNAIAGVYETDNREAIIGAINELNDISSSYNKIKYELEKRGVL